MVISITTNIKDTVKFVKNAQVNIRRSQTALAKRAGKFGKERVQFHAPKWRDTLSNRVIMKLFPNIHKAQIMMASQRFNEIALQNEMNIKGMRKLYKSAYPKLGKWAEDKGVFQDKPYVIVGGRNTRLGRQNIFFFPAFMDLQKAVPTLALEVFTEAIKKTRG